MLFYLFCAVTFIQVLYYWLLFRHVSFFRQKAKQKSQQHPVSVIVCARDEAANLAKNLPGVLVQQYDSTREVIVVIITARMKRNTCWKSSKKHSRIFIS
ncbi:MAG: hypothetical protein EOO00_05105 [Chitinophagaceae bacterium]|nr:MAG: hypothetical protein EOO00_05105 [Chitinophagaceae bacterium]